MAARAAWAALLSCTVSEPVAGEEDFAVAGLLLAAVEEGTAVVWEGTAAEREFEIVIPCSYRPSDSFLFAPSPPISLIVPERVRKDESVGLTGRLSAKS